ncbi:hypothetical protein GOP47_0030000 [Adiantum capillus-veneris]|nr:hypothetical protein GOP47_0030000 [Adiantum capillus-veneris]
MEPKCPRLLKFDARKPTSSAFQTGVEKSQHIKSAITHHTCHIITGKYCRFTCKSQSDMQATVHRCLTPYNLLILRHKTERLNSGKSKDVHMPLERMEELSSTFENEEIDGSKLLSLERSSYACSNMTDTEWLLLHAARESLVNHERTVEMLSENQSPSTSKSSEKELQENDFNSNVTRLQGSLIPTSAQSPGSLLSYLRFLSLPRNLWSSSASKQEQKEPATAEVYLLQEEVLTAQEREASLKARMDHLDQVLRTSQLASYLYTRFRWTPLPGELPVDDDAEVDDWLQRFLVLGGSTLFFYPQAADFRPQGAIIMREVVDMGYISGQFLHEQENVKWFGFQVTTSQGLRLECATPLKQQAELWMSLLQDAQVEHHSEGAYSTLCKLERLCRKSQPY